MNRCCCFSSSSSSLSIHVTITSKSCGSQQPAGVQPWHCIQHQGTMLARQGKHLAGPETSCSSLATSSQHDKPNRSLTSSTSIYLLLSLICSCRWYCTKALTRPCPTNSSASTSSRVTSSHRMSRASKQNRYYCCCVRFSGAACLLVGLSTAAIRLLAAALRPRIRWKLGSLLIVSCCCVYCLWLVCSIDDVPAVWLVDDVVYRKSSIDAESSTRQVRRCNYYYSYFRSYCCDCLCYATLELLMVIVRAARRGVQCMRSSKASPAAASLLLLLLLLLLVGGASGARNTTTCSSNDTCLNERTKQVNAGLSNPNSSSQSLPSSFSSSSQPPVDSLNSWLRIDGGSILRAAVRRSRCDPQPPIAACPPLLLPAHHAKQVANASTTPPRPNQVQPNRVQQTTTTKATTTKTTAAAAVVVHVAKVGHSNVNASQCLPYLHTSQKECICAQPGDKRMDTVRKFHLQHCYHYNLWHVLNDSMREGIARSEQQCNAYLDLVGKWDNLAAQFICQFEDIIRRYDCAQSFSVKSSCNKCKVIGTTN